MRKRIATTVGLAAVALAAAVAATGAIMAGPSDTSVASGDTGGDRPRGERRAIAGAMSVAHADNPFVNLRKAERAAGRRQTGWSPNVASVRMVSLPRSTALTQMGQPDAVAGDDRDMVLFELVGEFALRVYPHPSSADGAPVRSPVLLLAIDPDSGDTLDFSMQQEPVSLTGDVSILLNRQASQVSLDTNRSRSKLKVDVSPDRDARNYQLIVYRVRRGSWHVYRELTTTGASDLAEIDAPNGIYRVISRPGAKLAGSSSSIVRLRK